MVVSVGVLLTTSLLPLSLSVLPNGFLLPLLRPSRIDNLRPESVLLRRKYGLPSPPAAGLAPLLLATDPASEPFFLPALRLNDLLKEERVHVGVRERSLSLAVAAIAGAVVTAVWCGRTRLGVERVRRMGWPLSRPFGETGVAHDNHKGSGVMSEQ